MPAYARFLPLLFAVGVGSVFFPRGISIAQERAREPSPLVNQGGTATAAMMREVRIVLSGYEWEPDGAYYRGERGTATGIAFSRRGIEAALRKLLPSRSEPLYIRVRSALGLAHFPTRRNQHLLAKCAEVGPELLRRACIATLGKAFGERVAPTIANHLASPSEVVRTAAAAALLGTRHPEAVDALESQLIRERSPLVREAIRAALDGRSKVDHLDD